MKVLEKITDMESHWVDQSEKRTKNRIRWLKRENTKKPESQTTDLNTEGNLTRKPDEPSCLPEPELSQAEVNINDKIERKKKKHRRYGARVHYMS